LREIFFRLLSELSAGSMLTGSVELGNRRLDLVLP